MSNIVKVSERVGAVRNATSPVPKALPLRAIAITLLVLALLSGGIFAALWLAGIFFQISLHQSPLHTNGWTWIDAVSACRAGVLHGVGRRLSGAAIMALLVTFGGPPLAVWGVLNAGSQRELYGSARFASEAEIRRAGLL